MPSAYAWFSPASATVVLGLCLVLSVGCGTSRKPDPESGPPPAAFQPEAFQDVPRPQGYAPLAGSEQLAVAYGNGQVRRLLTTYRQVLENAATGDELKQWYQVQLNGNGWQIVSDRWPKRQEWVKRSASGAEMLRIESKREGDKTLIRLTVAPQITAGPGTTPSGPGRR